MSLRVYIFSQSNRCEPDAGTSDLRTTVIVSMFTDKNGLGMHLKKFEWVRKRETVN